MEEILSSIKRKLKLTGDITLQSQLLRKLRQQNCNFGTCLGCRVRSLSNLMRPSLKIKRVWMQLSGSGLAKHAQHSKDAGRSSVGHAPWQRLNEENLHPTDRHLWMRIRHTIKKGFEKVSFEMTLEQQ